MSVVSAVKRLSNENHKYLSTIIDQFWYLKNFRKNKNFKNGIDIIKKKVI